jgi:hypothetical protein
MMLVEKKSMTDPDHGSLPRATNNCTAIRFLVHVVYITYEAS